MPTWISFHGMNSSVLISLRWIFFPTWDESSLCQNQHSRRPYSRSRGDLRWKGLDTILIISWSLYNIFHLTFSLSLGEISIFCTTSYHTKSASELFISSSPPKPDILDIISHHLLILWAGNLDLTSFEEMKTWTSIHQTLLLEWMWCLKCVRDE